MATSKAALIATFFCMLVVTILSTQRCRRYVNHCALAPNRGARLERSFYDQLRGQAWARVAAVRARDGQRPGFGRNARRSSAPGREVAGQDLTRQSEMSALEPASVSWNTPRL